MELTVRGKNLEITDALHSYVEKHTGKIQRYFDKPIKIGEKDDPFFDRCPHRWTVC